MFELTTSLGIVVGYWIMAYFVYDEVEREYNN